MSTSRRISSTNGKLKWAFLSAALVAAAMVAGKHWNNAPVPAEPAPRLAMPEEAVVAAPTEAIAPTSRVSLPANPAEAMGEPPRRIADPPKSLVTLADWSRYPSGLMVAVNEALQQQDGLAAYELVRILRDCAGLPEYMEGVRANFADMQTRGILKQDSRHLADMFLASMQRDQAHCQTLTGDSKILRRQLLQVAVRAGVHGSGMSLLSDGIEVPWVTQQVLREAEAGHGLALQTLANGDIPQATRLQRDAARDALVRGAQDPALNVDPFDNLQRHLVAVERHVAVEVARADPGNADKATAADAAYAGKGAPKLKPSTDPQVRALADQYLAALKKRQTAARPS